MKNYFRVVCGAIILGGIIAFLFYRDIKNEVIAITNDNNKVYLFQTGVFKSNTNALNFMSAYPSAGIYHDDDLYRVIIAATTSNKQKLEIFFKSEEINYYIKEVYVDDEVIRKINEYDKVLINTDNIDVINNINKASVELFLSLKP